MKPRKTVRQRLGEKIAAKVKEDFGIDLVDFELWPNQGAWRTNRTLDVMPWTGCARWVKKEFSNPVRVSLCSWDTMTELLQSKGFTIERATGWAFELYAEDPQI